MSFIALPNEMLSVSVLVFVCLLTFLLMSKNDPLIDGFVSGSSSSSFSFRVGK